MHGCDLQEDLNIGRGAIEYFQGLFRSQNPTSINFALQGISPKISTPINDQLLPLSIVEVCRAVFQMPADKAPRPVGYTAAFYQQYWNLIESDLTSFLQDFLNTSRFSSGTNHTHVCLIPIIPNPRTFGKFRPISLCNVIYKILSKVLVNRLKPHLLAITSETQAAFIRGRQMHDHILLAHELIHHIWTCPKKSPLIMAIKPICLKHVTYYNGDYILGVCYEKIGVQ